METINNVDSFLKYFRPELALIVGLLVLLVRAMSRKSHAPADRLPMLIAFVTLAVSLALSVFGPPATGMPLFGGMMSHDKMALFFKVVILATALVITLVADSSRDLLRAPKPEFYAFLLTLTLGLIVLSGASDLLVIYLAIEMASILSYILTGYLAGNSRSDEAGLKYVFFGGLASGIMIFGISLLYGLTGSLNLLAINAHLTQTALNPEGWAVLYVAFVMVFAGLGYKMAVAPFHMWSPDVYEGAPLPVTAFLSVASKAAGFAVTIRFFFVGFLNFGPEGWIAIKQIDWKSLMSALAILTMTIGNLAALKQTNIKRFLAYSSVAHAGYMLMGLATQSQEGVLAILLYFGVYFLMNLGAFLVAMYMANEFGTETIDDYKGLSRRKGAGFVLAFCLGVFLLSLAGLPPFAGFIGKLYLFGAVVKAGLYPLAVVGVLNSVVSLYYYVKIVKYMFFDEPATSDAAKFATLRFATVVPAFAFLTLLLGIYFAPLADWVKASAEFLY